MGKMCIIHGRIVEVGFFLYLDDFTGFTRKISSPLPTIFCSIKFQITLLFQQREILMTKRSLNELLIEHIRQSKWKLHDSEEINKSL